MADKTVKWGEVSRRFQEIKPGEFAEEVYTVSAVTAAVAQQRFFLAGSGRLSLSVAGNVRATIANPADSGRNMFLARLVSFGTGTAWATLLVNPTTGLPVTPARPHLNAIAGAPGGVGVLKVDTDAATPLGGGVDTGIVLGSGANTRNPVDLPPIILAPGVTLGINVPFAGAADIALSLYWLEEDV